VFNKKTEKLEETAKQMPAKKKKIKKSGCGCGKKTSK